MRVAKTRHDGGATQVVDGGAVALSTYPLPGKSCHFDGKTVARLVRLGTRQHGQRLLVKDSSGGGGILLVVRQYDRAHVFSFNREDGWFGRTSSSLVWNHWTQECCVLHLLGRCTENLLLV